MTSSPRTGDPTKGVAAPLIGRRRVVPPAPGNGKPAAPIPPGAAGAPNHQQTGPAAMTCPTDHADDDEQRAAAIRELQRLFGVLEASIVTRRERAHAMVVSNLLPTEDELRADPEWHRAAHRTLDAERRITDAVMRSDGWRTLTTTTTEGATDGPQA